MEKVRESEIRWVLFWLALATAIAAIDAALGADVVLIALLSVPVLAVATRAGPRLTASVAAFVFALAIPLGIPDDIFGETRHLLALAVMALTAILAIWIAHLRARAERAERRSTFIAEAGTRLDASLDYATTMRTLAELAVPTLADWCAAYELADGKSIRQLAAVHREPGKEQVAWELERRYPFHLDQPLGVAAAIKTGQPQLMPEISDSAIDENKYDDEHAELVRSLGLRSAMFLPLRARGRTLGAMAFAMAESGRTLAAKDLELAKDLADRAALAIDNARLYTELAAAESEVRQSGYEVEAVLQGIASAITVQNARGELVYANQAAVEMLGFPSAEALLETPPERIVQRFEMSGEDEEPLSVKDLPGRIALAGGDPDDVVVRFKDKTGGPERWSIVKARPILDEGGKPSLVVNIFDDITKQKRDELAQRFLAESSRLLGGSLDYEATLDNVAHLAVPDFADWCSVDMLDDAGAIKNVAIAHFDPSKVEMAEDLQRRYPPDPDIPRGVPQVIRTGEPELYPELPDELLVDAAQDEMHLALIRKLGLRSAMTVPMLAHGQSIGAITLVTAESGRRFDQHDLELAQELGRRAGAAVQNARVYAERSHIARTLQSSLLPPRLPDVPGVEVAARFRAAGEAYEVGGDFYDLFNTGGAGWAIVIGDVCGKGPGAAALTGLARYTVRTAAMQEREPSRILTLLNEAIINQRFDSQFCTAALGRLELKPVGAQLTVSSGGHPLPLVLREDGRVEQLGVPGTLLGAVAEPELVDQGAHLDPGVALVFYTDGVTEAGIPRGAFGLGGLTAVLKSCVGLSATETAERIENAVAGLEEDPSDDVAVLVLRIRE